MSTRQLTNQLIAAGVLKNPRVIEAFRHIDRANFVPDDFKDEAYLNAPLPIGYNQTISQPLTVAFMLELLQPQPGDRILDIGSGSGWQTALLAHLVGSSGSVFALEVIPELHEQSIKNISPYNFIAQGTVKMLCQNAASGLPDESPFDKIIAAAELDQIPPAWLGQLKQKGHLVAPVGHSLVLVTKKANGDLERKEYPGFVFVPFVTP